MVDAYVGEIRLWSMTRIPNGWQVCDGSVLAVSANPALFSLIGTTYGGDGSTTFALPDLRGHLPIGAGQGPNMTNRVIGQTPGSESVTLTANNAPAHTHPFYASSNAASSLSPSSSLTVGASPTGYVLYTKSDATGVTPIAYNQADVSSSGGSQPHENRMPATALNYIICLVGLYPQSV